MGVPKLRKIILLSVAAIVILVALVYSYIFYSYRNISYVKPKKDSINIKQESVTTKINDSKDSNLEDVEEKPTEEESVNYREIDGITNVLLIGTDGREINDPSRSDTIMILTIDDVHKKLKLTSIMRDSYAEIPGHGEQKINHSFAYGQADLLMKTIEKNFKIKLDKYAIINFSGFKELVDAIDGLDIEVSEVEREELNRCILGLEEYKRNYFGEEPHLLKESGLQHLDGQQVLAYARMRHIEGGSYARNERQRDVVNMIANKLKDTSLIKYPSVMTKLMKCVKTNIDFNEGINLAYTAFKTNNFNMSQLQIPVNKLSYSILYKNKGWVLLMDKESNTKVMQDFIFEDIPLDESKYPYFNYAKSEYYYVPEKEKNEIIVVDNKTEENNKSSNDPLLNDSTDKSNTVVEENTDNNYMENNTSTEDKSSNNEDENNTKTEVDITSEDNNEVDIQENDESIEDNGVKNNTDEDKLIILR